MVTLKLLNQFRLFAQGLESFGKQGETDDYPETPFELTVTGNVYRQGSSLATATVNTLWTAAVDFPATFDFGFLWVDQDAYVQLIGTASNSVHKVEAKVPFTIPGFGSVLGSGSTTLITGGAEPAVTALAKIALGNYSGSTLNYALWLVD